MTVARRVARELSRPIVRGATIAFASDLPPAAGMSSSSALMVATFLALSALNELPRRAVYSPEPSRALKTWPATWPRSRTGRPTAAWPVITGSEPSEEARTIRRSCVLVRAS